MNWKLIVLFMFLVACAKPAPVETAEPMTKTEMMGIAMAMKLGKPIKCVSEQAGQKATIYMKGSKMRMDTMPADAHGIYTEDMMYTWQGKQGMMMRMEDIKKMAETTGQEYKPKTQEDIVISAEQSNAQCESAEVSEGMFVPPGDVQFQDLTEMMKQVEAMSKGMQK